MLAVDSQDDCGIPPGEGRAEVLENSASARTDTLEKLARNSFAFMEARAHARALGRSTRVIHVRVNALAWSFSSVFIAEDLNGNMPVRAHIAVFDAVLCDFVRVVADELEVSIGDHGVLNVNIKAFHASVPIIWDERMMAIYIECHPFNLAPKYGEYKAWVRPGIGFTPRVPLCSIDMKVSKGKGRGSKMRPFGMPVASAVAPRGWVFSFGSLAGIGFGNPDPNRSMFCDLLDPVLKRGGDSDCPSEYYDMFFRSGLPWGGKANISAVAYMCGLVHDSLDGGGRPRVGVSAWAGLFCQIMDDLRPGSFIQIEGERVKFLDEGNDEVSAILESEEFALVDVFEAGFIAVDDKARADCANVVSPGSGWFKVTVPNALCDYVRQGW